MAAKSASKARSRPAVPDRLDLRDRPYMPAIGVIPGAELAPAKGIPILDQGQTNACTGFALASVLFHLQRKAKRAPAESRVSPYMLYWMARRYDEFPGKPEADTGSSARGAMKGWFNYGACAADLWPRYEMPKPKNEQDAWWLDAVRRPLGAYYRVDHRSVTDMHVALNEVGILYVTAACHSGWDGGAGARVKGWWPIPRQKANPTDGGHAFVIVGYNGDGFIIQNSWGTGWGSGGHALLEYDDWLDNAMDCWVAQLGVTTELHEEVAQAQSLRVNKAKQVQIAADPTLRTHEINPFIIDMENNGQLSNTGAYRTSESDIDALVTTQVGLARAAWGLKKGDVMDVAIYAHGGLTSEEDAAATAAKWIPALYDARVFPIFLMWETDLLSTLEDRLSDAIKGEPRAAGGMLDAAKKWWNERIEKLIAHPGTLIWGEMKQNGEAISRPQTDKQSEGGGAKLYKACAKSPFFSDRSKVRLHLIGHSAGSIVHCYIVNRLGAFGWKFESVNFMAPAVRVDEFQRLMAPALKKGTVRRLNQFHLTDEVEQRDTTCRPILGYGRSLLYLVSRSFENGVTTPILGMATYFSDAVAGLSNVRAWTAPGPQSQSTTHGGFDDDDTTMKSVIALIQGKAI